MSTATATSYTGTFQGRAEEVSCVRRQVARFLGDCPVTDDAVLAASEFAANAVLHSRSRGEHFTIRVQRHSDHVRVECQDAGGPWRGKHQDDDRPHGLRVVEALTGGPADWGVQVTGDGRIVWARITW
jgi:anti-sigma regulatory factor (Ser/Thr protein kinase)